MAKLLKVGTDANGSPVTKETHDSAHLKEARRCPDQIYRGPGADRSPAEARYRPC